MIKKLLIATTLLLSSQANAAWVAYASSSSAWGKGFSSDLNTAKRIALRECAIRTPSWDTCFITGWEWR